MSQGKYNFINVSSVYLGSFQLSKKLPNRQLTETPGPSYRAIYVAHPQGPRRHCGREPAPAWSTSSTSPKVESTSKIRSITGSLFIMRPTLILQNLLFYTKNTKCRPYRFQHHLQPWQRNSQRYLWSGPKVPTDDSTTQSKNHMNPGTESPDSKLSATGISLATRMSTDRKFQCTQFDKKGDIYMGHGHIQRSELVSKVSVIFLRGKKPMTYGSSVRNTST